jgi:hypothetical protein
LSIIMVAFCANTSTSPAATNAVNTYACTVGEESMIQIHLLVIVG